MGAGQNKTTLTAANGFQNAAAACACVYVNVICECECVFTTSLQKQREEVGAERKNERDNQWLMAFPQGYRFLQLTVKHGEPQGSSY